MDGISPIAMAGTGRTIGTGDIIIAITTGDKPTSAVTGATKPY
jgi:hypothetical protein